MNTTFQKRIEDFLSENEKQQFLKGRKKQTNYAQYQYSHVPVEEVEKNIDEYIIPELQPALKALLEKNIFTFMCSNQDDKNIAYIILDDLTEVNEALFQAYRQEKPENFLFDGYRQANRIQIKDTSTLNKQEISDKFLELVKGFILQDVPKKFYLEKEDYLVKCGCFNEIDNPKYKKVGTMPTKNAAESPRQYLKRLDEWTISLSIPKTIKVFDETKVKKSLDEYVQENGDEDKFDKENERVYISPYFLQKHKNYVERKKTHSNKAVM